MSSRVSSLIVAFVALAVVVAQIFLPGQAVFHTWQYALALAVLAYLLVSYAAPAIRGHEGSVGRMFGIALVGVLICVAAGLASGLLGPDTERIVRAPGTIAPLPEVGAAAFFSNADPRSIENGTGSVTLRRRNHLDIVVNVGSHKFLGGLMLGAEPVPAAFLDASDRSGNHLTITQQGSNTFLSPVLLLVDQQSIAGEMHPVGGFELPGAKRSVKVVYFRAQDVLRLHFPVPPDAAGKPALLFDVFDDANKSIGIALGLSGDVVSVGGVRIRATVGRYPQLVIVSVPVPLALVLGFALFLFGTGAAAVQSSKRMLAPPTEGKRPEGDTEKWQRLRSRLKPTRQRSGTSQD